MWQNTSTESDSAALARVLFETRQFARHALGVSRQFRGWDTLGAAEKFVYGRMAEAARRHLQETSRAGERRRRA